ILVATVFYHALAAWAGALIAAWVGPDVMRWVLGLSFIAMAAWMLVPDKMDEDDQPKSMAGAGAFLTTVVAFFLLEMGDKTQVATVALSARFQSVAWVTAGTTLGMMVADVPAVFLGKMALTKIPLKVVHTVSAVLFLLLGIAVLANLGISLEAAVLSARP
ncbi:MAG TPA: TMEM165/GDT1 family protein, partial [Magnetospirillum sp.]|nr:TMEM165/GDT1 family protein [Magnetospirillum sp.]